MKKIWYMLIPLAGLLILIGMATAFAETNGAVNFDELITDFEPIPCSVSSHHETTPFDPIVLDPYALLEQIDKCKRGDAILAFSRSLSLPLSAGDCDYIAQCRNDRVLTRYSLPEGRWAFNETITLTYTYADYEESSDNMVLIFIGDGETFHLTDILSSVDDMQIVTDANRENIWFVGETRYGQDKSTRWYNLKSRKFDLSYLVNGLMPDRIDYHVKVQSLADPIINGTIAENGMFAVRKQVSLVDYTSEERTAEAPEIILHSQIDIYACHTESGLTLVKSKKYKDATLKSIAGITCEQIMNEDD